MAIKLTPGNLYFIRDIDYLSGEVGKYVKIGIVTNDRTTDERMSDHQTGNPRGIFEVHEVENVPFVERLETHIHYEHNEKWITGEWFLLDEKEAELVYQRALILKDKQMAIKKTVYKVLKELTESVSNGKMKKATKAALQLENRWLDIRKQINVLAAKIDISKFNFYTILGANGSIDGVLNIQYKNSSTKFDEKAFELAHSTIYTNFLISQPDKLQKSFDMDKVSTVSLEKTDPLLNQQKKAIGKMTYTTSQLKNKLARNKNIEQLHFEHMMLVREHKLLSFEQEMVEYQIKEIVGNHEGIDGICKWTRKMKNSSDTLDTAALKKAYPKLYEQFFTKKVSHSFAMEIEKFRAYKPL
jgi:hypothetical protein